MNDKKPMTVAEALRISSWIFTAGALFFLLMFIKARRPIVAIGFLLIAFCICPLSEKIFEKIKKKIKFNPRIPAIILSLVAFRGFILLNNAVIDSMNKNKTNDVPAIVSVSETSTEETTLETTTVTETITEKITTTPKATTTTKIITTVTEETTTEVTSEITAIPPVTTTILETKPPQTAPPEQPVQKHIESHVYIAASGKGSKYHLNPDCSNMNGNVIELTVDEAVAQGYSACKKCG